MKPEATVHFAVANLPQVEVQPAVEVPSAAVESKPEVTVVASAPVVKAAPSSAVKSQATVQSASLVAMPVVMMPVAPRSAYLFSDAEVLRLLAMSAGRSEIAERELVLGRKHWSAGNYQGAMVRFTEAVRSNPESTLAWSYRAICLLNMGDELAAAQAIDQAARLIEKYPSDRSMLYQSLARVQGGARLRFESLLRLSSVERSRQASASPSFAGR